CSFCPESFANGPNLTRHIAVQHAKGNISQPPAVSTMAQAEKLWARVPLWHPQRHNVINVITSIRQLKVNMGTPIDFGYHHLFQTEPSHNHILEDFMSTKFHQPGAPGALISTANGLAAPNLEKNDLIASFRACDSKLLGPMSPSRLCAASGIQPSTRGITAC
ncbi:hypothetical protein V8E36_002787, partial [Tilletia maclaganii]